MLMLNDLMKNIGPLYTVHLSLPLPPIYEDKNNKKRQGKHHHPGLQQEYG